MRGCLGLSRVTVVVLSCLVIASSLSSGSDTITWTNIGPGFGGNVRFHAVSPTDPNIILAGTDVGGLQRSTDGGITWTLVNDAFTALDEGANYNIYHGVAFHPNGNILVSGPFRSTDQGAHWTRFDKHFSGSGGLFDSAGTAYVFDYNTVRRSTCAFDGTCATTTSCVGGGTPPCYDMNINALVYDKLNLAHLIACADTGVYRSENSGATWTAIANGFPGYPDPVQCNGIAIHQVPVGGSFSQPTLFVVLETKAKNANPNDPDCPADATLRPGCWAGGAFRGDGWSSQGSVTWSPINGSTGALTNLIDNGGFENPADQCSPTPGAPVKWTLEPANSVTRVCDVKHSGTWSMKLDYPSGQYAKIYTSPRIPVEAGKLYRFSGWFKVNPGSTGVPVNATVTAYLAEPSPTSVKWIDTGQDHVYTANITSLGSSDWRKLETLITPVGTMESFKIELTAQAADPPAGGSGTIWVDDIALEEYNALPQVSGFGQSPSFASYSAVAVHPNNPQIIYVGTGKGSFTNLESDIGGVWRTTDGGATWKNVTRAHYKDNVMDDIGSSSTCGDGVCAGKMIGGYGVYGRWEDVFTCPQDCHNNCGNLVWEAGEDQSNCLIDTYQGALQNDIELNRPYWEAITAVDANNNPHFASGHDRGMNYDVWNIAATCPTVPCQCNDESCLRVYWGAEHMRSFDGGGMWEDFSSKGRTPQDTTPPVTPVVAWTARGQTTDTYAYRVVTDPRDTSRIYYADKDNRLQVSLDGGKSFNMEGWQWAVSEFLNPTIALGAGNVVLGPDVNTIYVASSPPPGNIANPEHGGVVKGTYNDPPGDAMPYWTWEHLVGNKEVFPKGGGIEMLRDATGNLFMSIFGKGVYKLSGEGANLTCLGGTGTLPYTPPTPPGGPTVPGIDCTSANLKWKVSGVQQTPTGWETYPIACVTSGSPAVCDTTQNRLYVGTGDLTIESSLEATDRTGVWESENGGTDWCKISSPAMAGKPIMALRASGPNTLFAGTWDPRRTPAPEPGGGYQWQQDSGIYRGTRNALCDWTWTRVLAEPRISSIVVAPGNPMVLYAASAQMSGTTTISGQHAGIYKSKDGGSSWDLTNNTTLMCLRDVRLDFKANDATTLYASTEGSGVFVANDTSDGDGDGVIDVLDNCPTVANANQYDCDDDGIGDACGDYCQLDICSNPTEQGSITHTSANLYASSSGIIVGDQKTANKQVGYRSFLSFDTSSLGLQSTVLSAIITMTPTSVSGTVGGTSSFRTLRVHGRNGYFGSNSTLELTPAPGDYGQTTSVTMLTNALPFPTVTTDHGLRTLALTGSTELNLISRTGTTQFRLQFHDASNNPIEWDGDSENDQVSWQTSGGSCPKLTVQYTAP